MFTVIIIMQVATNRKRCNLEEYRIESTTARSGLTNPLHTYTYGHGLDMSIQAEQVCIIRSIQ